MVSTSNSVAWSRRLLELWQSTYWAARLGPWLAVLAFASVIYAGVFAANEAIDVDTRYFYVAGKVWLAGKSPYDMAEFRQMFALQFPGLENHGFYAYLPPSIAYAVPAALFDWPRGALLFRLLNLSATLGLAACLLSYIKHSRGSALQLGDWCWVCLAFSVGAVPATILTGQTSIFASLGIAAAIVGTQRGRPWLAVLGVFLAASKPHLSGFALLALFITERKQRRGLLLGAIAVAVACVVLLLDSAPIAHLRESFTQYRLTSANSPAKLVGLAPLLIRAGTPEAWAIRPGFLILAGALFALLRANSRRASPGIVHAPSLLWCTVALTGIAFPIQGYDVVVLAPALMAVALQRPALQLMMALPALLLWRASVGVKLLGLAGLEVAPNTVSTAAWLVLLLGAWSTHLPGPATREDEKPLPQS